VEKCVDFCSGGALASALELSGVLWFIDAKACRVGLVRVIAELIPFLDTGFLLIRESPLRIMLPY